MRNKAKSRKWWYQSSVTNFTWNLKAIERNYSFKFTFFNQVILAKLAIWFGPRPASNFSRSKNNKINNKAKRAVIYRRWSVTFTPFLGFRIISTTAGLEWNELKWDVTYVFSDESYLEVCNRKCRMIQATIIFSSYMAKRWPKKFSLSSIFSSTLYRLTDAIPWPGGEGNVIVRMAIGYILRKEMVRIEFMRIREERPVRSDCIVGNFCIAWFAGLFLATGGSAINQKLYMKPRIHVVLTRYDEPSTVQCRDWRLWERDARLK